MSACTFYLPYSYLLQQYGAGQGFVVDLSITICLEIDEDTALCFPDDGITLLTQEVIAICDATIIGSLGSE
jgi:hypothetical protein